MTKAKRKSMTNKSSYSQRSLIGATNIVPNNPEHPDETPDDEEQGITLYDSRNHRIWERINKYRNNIGYYKTMAGHFKQRDEPGEQDSYEVRRHNQYLDSRHQQKKDAREILKKKDKVPVKSGNPMWEQYQLHEEAASNFYAVFRKLYYSGKSMKFKQWLEEIGDLLEHL